MTEIWKPVVGFETTYEVSNKGNVRRLRSGILKPQKNNRGYLKVTLSNKNKKAQPLIHVLVSEAFISPRRPGFTVNHKDGVKTHNFEDNLEYITLEDNILHATQILKVNVGENNKRHKLKNKQVVCVSCLSQMGLSQSRLSKHFGVNFRTIHYHVRKAA